MTRSYRVIVVELDDVVERHRPDRPNLYIGTTERSRSERYKQLQRGRGPDWIQGHVVCLRPDLYRNYQPVSREEAPRQKARLATKLKRRAFTVNGDTTVWSLYVVQLDESRRDDVGKGWIYVGETSIDPDARLHQHLSGAVGRVRLYSPVVKRNGQSLRRDLMQGLPHLYSSTDSKRAEAELAERLRDEGYRVEGGH
ncbi:MAG: hypothetical protein U9R51_04185 [Actinomycetota bacterium]|nr:hypothetical protein [Actinomycetota bacterium]